MKWNEKMYEWTKEYGPLEWTLVGAMLTALVIVYVSAYTIL